MIDLLTLKWYNINEKEVRSIKASDHFKSMDDVRACCEYWKKYTKNEEEARLLEKVFGLGPQEGDAVEVEGVGLIDVSISGYVKEFNVRGYKTLACCSGLAREHKGEGSRGYLCFVQSDKTQAMLQAVCTEVGMEFEEGECYLLPCYEIRFKGEEEDKEQGWERFFSHFSRYIDKE